MVNNILGSGLRVLFPQYCLLCGLRTYREQPLCRPCERELPANDCCCARCALPLPRLPHEPTPPHPEQRLCGQCLVQPPPFAATVAPWLYCDQLAYLIGRWKYGREWRLTGLLAYLWRQHPQRLNDVDLLVPVPLHWRKQWRRGANQAELFCQALSRELLNEMSRELLNEPYNESHSKLSRQMYRPSLLRRQRATTAQSSLDATRRRANLHGAFTVRERCDNLRIAIVDDVLTTGATAAAVSDALLDAGAGRVEVWCLARTPSPQHNTG